MTYRIDISEHPYWPVQAPDEPDTSFSRRARTAKKCLHLCANLYFGELRTQLESPAFVTSSERLAAMEALLGGIKKCVLSMEKSRGS